MLFYFQATLTTSTSSMAVPY